MTPDEHLDASTMAAYLDDALSTDERRRAVAHFADCADCRARLAAQVRAEARDADAPPLAAGGHRSGWVPLLAAAAVGALLLGFGLWLAADDDRRAGPVARRGEPLATVPAPGGGEADPVPGAPDPATPDAAPDLPRPELPPAVQEGPAPGAADEELLALRGGTRIAAGKTFRLRDGAWIDTAYSEPDHGAPRELHRGTPAYEELSAREPRVATWAGVGPQVVIILDSIAYRLLPPAD